MQRDKLIKLLSLYSSSLLTDPWMINQVVSQKSLVGL